MRRRLWPLSLSLSLFRGESHHHSDPVDRSLSGWLVVDQLYRKNLVNFVSTSTGYCTANHWPVSLVTRTLLVPTLRSNNAPRDDTMGTDDTYESNIENVHSLLFQSRRRSSAPSIEISYSTDIFLDHLHLEQMRIRYTAFVSKEHFSRRNTDPNVCLLLNYD